MAEPRLEIGIGADNKQLQAIIKNSIENLKQLETAAKKLDRSKLGDVGGKAGKGFQDLGNKAANALPALTDVSRVIQDAPFGIIGVGNNITQLATSFGNLSKATGNPIKAIKALGASLAGPGGLVFGVSTAVSLLTVLGPELFKFENATTRLVQAQAEAAGTARANAIELQALVGIAKDAEASDNARARALDQLKEKYGQYLGDLTQEKLLTEETTKLIDQLTESLQRQALARGAMDLITEKSQELFKVQNDLGESLGFAEVAMGALKSVLDPTSTAAVAVTEAMDTQKERVAELQAEIGQLTTAYIDLQQKALDVTPQKIDKNTKALVKQAQDLQKVVTEPISQRGITVDLENLGAGVSGQIKAKLKENYVNPITEAQAETVLLLSQFDAQVGEIVTGGIANTFSQLGNLIGEGLAGGQLKFRDFAAVVLGGLGDMLSRVGDAAIQAGIASEALQKALINPLGGGLGAIAAGVALKAFSSTLTSGIRSATSAVSGGVGGIAGGGGSTSAVSAPTVLQGGEQVVVFKIQGTSLVGVLNRTLQRQGRTVSDLL